MPDKEDYCSGPESPRPGLGRSLAHRVVAKSSRVAVITDVVYSSESKILKKEKEEKEEKEEQEH